MDHTFSKTSRMAIAFAAITLIGVNVFVGSEDNSGILAQTQAGLGAQNSSEQEENAEEFRESTEDQREVYSGEDNAEFMSDADLIDDPRGFDPAGMDARGFDPRPEREYREEDYYEGEAEENVPQANDSRARELGPIQNEVIVHVNPPN